MRRKKCLMLLVLHQTYRRPLDGLGPWGSTEHVLLKHSLPAIGMRSYLQTIFLSKLVRKIKPE